MIYFSYLSSGNTIHKTNEWKFCARKIINVKQSKTRHRLFLLSPPIKRTILGNVSTWVFGCVPPTIHSYAHTYVHTDIHMSILGCMHTHSKAVKIPPSLRQNSWGTHCPWGYRVQPFTFQLTTSGLLSSLVNFKPMLTFSF